MTLPPLRQLSSALQRINSLLLTLTALITSQRHRPNLITISARRRQATTPSYPQLVQTHLWWQRTSRACPWAGTRLRTLQFSSLRNCGIKSSKYQQEDYHVCTLYIASYAVNFAFENGAQSTITNVTHLNRMAYVIALPDTIEMTTVGPQFQALTYQAVWMAVAQQLIGRFADNSLSTRIFQTPVVGSKEFAPCFWCQLWSGRICKQ